MKRIPPALVVALAIEIVFGVARIVHYAHGDLGVDRGWQTFEYGVACATAVLAASGLFELARRLPARAALGARIAGVVSLARLGLYVAWLLLTIFGRHEDTLFAAVRYINWAGGLTYVGAAVGIGLATQRIALAIALPVFAALVAPVPPLAQLMWSWLDHSRAIVVVLDFAPSVVLGLAALAALVVACRDLPASEAERGDRAFERAAKALWLRIAAALSLAGLMLIVGVAHATSLLALLKLVMVAAPLVDAIALALFARAALGMARANVSRWLALAAAAFALWCTGVLCSQAVASYVALYDDHGYWGADPLELATLYPTLLPLLSATAIALVLAAITRLARRRHLDELTENATVRTGVFVVLVLGALFITRYGLERAMFAGGSGLIVIGVVSAAAASIYALVIAAKLCSQAGVVLASDPAGLPAAKLIKEGSR
jgi:hypothetical protein